MAPRVNPTPIDADNPSGSSTLAACIDWRTGDADSMSARANTSPLQMPDTLVPGGDTTAGLHPKAKTIDQFLVLGEESI